MAYKQRWMKLFALLDYDGSGDLTANDFAGAAVVCEYYYNNDIITLQVSLLIILTFRHLLKLLE